MSAAVNRAAPGAQTPAAGVRHQARRTLAPTEQLLTQGAELRIEIDAERGGEPARLLALMAEAAETGSGVPAALAGRHFSARTALGETVTDGAAVGDGTGIEVVAVPARSVDGLPRPAVAVDLEIEERV